MDQKIKTALGKVPFATIPLRALKGVARVFQYGARKYAAGNFYNAETKDGAAERYFSGFFRHLEKVQEPNGLYTASSLQALDPESGLPHLDHMICGLVMLRSILTKEGILAADPGVGKEPPQVEAGAPAKVIRDVYPNVTMKAVMAAGRNPERT